MNHDPDMQSTSGRLVAPETRLPVWDRLPDEPPDHAVPAPEHGSGPAAPAALSIPPSPSERRSSRGWIQTIIAGLLGAVLAVGGFQIIDDDPAPATPETDAAALTGAGAPEASNQPPATSGVSENSAGDAVAIGAAVIPSIVTVQVGVPTSNGIAIQGTGSGVVIDDGLIVTNEHVISVGSAFEVILSDGRTAYDARLVGSDPLTDVALLRVDAVDLQPIPFGDTSTLQAGDLAVAVGSPLGLEGGPSLTVGVLSAFGRQVRVPGTEQLYGMMQTDAPITSGSSGGALVDAQGRLIGITTAVGVSEVGVEGIGFATPVELMKRVVDELIADGEVNHALLGIFGGTTFSTADDGARIAAGVEVESVETGSGAAAAGLDPGDLITALDGEAVTTMEDLIEALRYRRGGDAVTVTVDNGAGERALDIVLGSRP